METTKHIENLIKILREHLNLCRQIDSLLGDLRSDLKAGTAGQGITDSTQKLEPLMLKLSKSDSAISELLKTNNAKDLSAYIETNSAGVEKEVATRLLSQVANLQDSIRQQIVNSATLLVNSKAFIDYNINVMSQTAASVTYGSTGAQSAQQGQRHRSVFEANV